MVSKAHRVSSCPHCGSTEIEFLGNDPMAKKERTIWRCRAQKCGRTFTSDTVARAEREGRLLQ